MVQLDRAEAGMEVHDPRPALSSGGKLPIHSVTDIRLTH